MTYRYTGPAIDHSLLSPSGRMSKRARIAAEKREAARLFPPGYWDAPVMKSQASDAKRSRLLRHAAELRALAARGMSPRKFARKAAALEAEAANLNTKETP